MTALPQPGREATVVVAIHHLSDDVVRNVTEACRRADVGYVLWTDAHPPRVTGGSTVLVGGLPEGERAVPAELLVFMTETAPGAPVLLLCNEPLARPAVSLHAGRVLLLGSGAISSEAKIYSEIRLLVARRIADCGRDRTTTRRLDDGSGAVTMTTSEHVGPSSWAIGLSCGRAELQGAQAPLVEIDEAGAMTAVIPLRTDLNLDSSAIPRAIDRLEPGDIESKLGAILGSAAGLLHLTSGAGEWIVYWPADDLPLWIFSPLRLPRLANVAPGRCDGAPRARRFKASAGDLTVALSSAIPAARHDRAGSELESAMCDGGPALLDRLEARLCNTGAPVLGVVAEVR